VPINEGRLRTGDLFSSEGLVPTVWPLKSGALSNKDGLVPIEWLLSSDGLSSNDGLFNNDPVRVSLIREFANSSKFSRDFCMYRSMAEPPEINPVPNDGLKSSILLLLIFAIFLAVKNCRKKSINFKKS
jgi:hypothetical protein